MLNIILWGVLGGLVGFLVFLATPILANEFGGMDTRTRVANWYFELSMKSYRRVMCLVTPHNDMDLYPASWDEEIQAESAGGGNTENKYQDPKGSVARCHNVPFTLAFTDRAKIIHPLDAHVGAALEKLEQQGRKWKKIPVKKGETETVIDAHSAHINVPDITTSVNLQSARKVLNESHEPGDAERTESDVEKSQRGFNSKDMVGLALIFFACFGGALAAWVIYSNTGDTESAVTLPVQLAGGFL